MKLEGSYTFEAPQNIVWDALLDPVLLGSVMPGSEGLEPLGDDKYKAVLKIQVGPVQGTFEGTVALADIKKPDSYRMDINGKGAPGFVKATGAVRLEAQDGKTIMHYQGDAQLGGRIASVGQRLIESSAKALTHQTLDGIAQQIQARVAAQKAQNAAAQGKGDTQPAASAAVAPKPPSRLSFTLGVLSKLFEEMVPAPYRPVVIGIAVVVLLLITYGLARVIFH